MARLDVVLCVVNLLREREGLGTGERETDSATKSGRRQIKQENKALEVIQWGEGDLLNCRLCKMVLRENTSGSLISFLSSFHLVSLLYVFCSPSLSVFPL